MVYGGHGVLLSKILWQNILQSQILSFSWFKLLLTRCCLQLKPLQISPFGGTFGRNNDWCSRYHIWSLFILYKSQLIWRDSYVYSDTLCILIVVSKYLQCVICMITLINRDLVGRFQMTVSRLSLLDHKYLWGIFFCVVSCSMLSNKLYVTFLSYVSSLLFFYSSYFLYLMNFSQIKIISFLYFNRNRIFHKILMNWTADLYQTYLSICENKLVCFCRHFMLLVFVYNNISPIKKIFAVACNFLSH